MNMIEANSPTPAISSGAPQPHLSLRQVDFFIRAQRHGTVVLWTQHAERVLTRFARDAPPPR
jgi:hypothetical protein